MTLEANLSVPVVVDMCSECQAFWFDKFESLKLSPASTLKLIRFIGEHAARGKEIDKSLECPRCAESLRLTKDLQRNTRFSYWRCRNEHGRFIRFYEFLREKNFIRQLSQREINELRRQIQTVNCSNCGAPIDLIAASDCSHCGTPVSMLDMKQPEQLIAQLKAATEPRPVDPALPLELARARHEVERVFAGLEAGRPLWIDVNSTGLVQAGLSALSRWLAKLDR